MQPDIVLEVRLRTTAEGGRQTVLEGERYGCPLLVDGDAFDCRLLLAGRKFELGRTYEVPIKFLTRDLVLPRLYVGKSVQLWEGKIIGDGVVVGILPYGSEHG